MSCEHPISILHIVRVSQKIYNISAQIEKELRFCHLKLKELKLNSLETVLKPLERRETIIFLLKLYFNSNFYGFNVPK